MDGSDVRIWWMDLEAEMARYMDEMDGMGG